MNIFEEAYLLKARYNTRRHFLKECSSGLGALALGSMMGISKAFGGGHEVPGKSFIGGKTHFPGRAKSVIFLHMSGAPSQLELFDYKPELHKLNGKPTPASLMEGANFAFLKGIPKLLGPQASFSRHGASGAWISDYMPHFSSIADDVTFLKAMHTDQFNHAPAQLFMHTGSALPGRPCIGAWSIYGLGTMNDDLPGFVVLTSGGSISAGKTIWGSGFLPTVYQGVHCRSVGDPVLYLSNPDGVDSKLRKRSIEAINEINKIEHEEARDPEILSRIAQYELAFRMQASVPEVMDINKEPAYIHEMYGTRPGEASFANNCLLARRLVEKGVRYIQLYDTRWDTHGVGKGNGVGQGLRNACNTIDKPITALIKDLKQRGLLEDTLVVWGGEFGRTPMMETRSGADFLGRDHHKEAFTMWLSGGGIKPGLSHGETDPIGYYGIKDRVHIHDLQATIMHQLGFDHERLTYHFQGRDFRLTDIHGRVVREIVG